MNPSGRINFEPVIAAGQHVHCCLDEFIVARITLYADHCRIDGPGSAPYYVRSEDEVREVVRMRVRRGALAEASRHWSGRPHPR